MPNNNKDNVLLKEWFDNLPFTQRANTRKIICDLLDWTNDMFYASLTRRTIKKPEKILLNKLAGEQIFKVEPIEEKILINN